MGFLFKSREKRAAEKAVRSAQSDPQKITHARSLINHPNLSNSERAQLYKELAHAPRYRNQRDNTQNPESTCNLTAMAMAFEGLGMALGDSTRVQGEENLYGDYYKKSRSRTNPEHRAAFAKEKGLETNQINTPSFASAVDAEKWFKEHILPRLQGGAQATMGIKSGSFRHVVRLQWVENKGLVIDDPYGEAVGSKGSFGYASLNTKQRETRGDQQGCGDNSFLDWETVANICKDRYVQVYDN